MSRRRPWAARVGLAALVVASVATSVVTVRQLEEARTDRSAAFEAQAVARTDRAGMADELAALERSLAVADDDAERDGTTASALDDASDQLALMRARIEQVRKQVAAKTAEVRKRQQPLDLLVSCQRSLDSAAGALRDRAAPDRASAAVGALEAGRGTCQRALSLVRGVGSAVHPYDFPDPFVLRLDGLGYLAYGTNGPGGSIQVLASTDLKAWKVLRPALTSVAAWAEPGYTWAPSVMRFGDRWVLYYAARVRGSKRQCISSATSTSPAGPFVDDTILPLVCQADLGGSIDPSPYRDELGFAHLAWKSESEVGGGRAGIWTQVVGGDGRTLFGPPRRLLLADRGWESRIVENPSMAKVGDQWVLLYSGNRWNSADYAMGYATCASAMGPCTRARPDPVVRTDATMQGPGGGELFRVGDGSLRVAFAAWDPGVIGYPNARRLHVATVTATPLGLVIG
ncbi:family 43 glycosylhydrolase [Aquihabitans sp. G128]|uniref:glycoside hydrolase family 43 protein n=1 Tax=Aquihabitans sp. G128 TaxID=2849779 RepID=UPI001C21B94A|nr:glycoside hydrolase family 43 protein [Aquihabitans sp. G128]QXC59303.1 family 43 glycosylhydrolase [Aquihabitans sp. G128]